MIVYFFIFYFLFLVFSLTTSVLWSLCEQLNLICIVFKRELMCQFPVNQVLRVNSRVLHRDSNPELVYSQKRQTAYQQGSQRQVISYCFLALLNTSDVEISNYSFRQLIVYYRFVRRVGFQNLQSTLWCTGIFMSILVFLRFLIAEIGLFTQTYRKINL